MDYGLILLQDTVSSNKKTLVIHDGTNDSIFLKWILFHKRNHIENVVVDKMNWGLSIFYTC